MKKRSRLFLVICLLHTVTPSRQRHERSVDEQEALFITEPASTKVIIGGSVTLNCAISGIPTQERNTSVQWSQNNFALGFAPLRNQRYIQQSGPKDYSLQIRDAQLDDSGAYECQAHTSFSRLRSQSARLEVLQPPEEVSIVPATGSSAKQVGDVIELVEGVETKLQCVSSASKPKTELDWIFQETILNGSELVTGERIFTTFSETKIIPRREHHGKQISCLARHEALAGDLARTLVLNVKTLPDVGLELNERTYRVGDSIQAQCLGSANPPISRYAWYMGEQLLEGENDSDLTLKGAAGQHLNGESVKCVAFNEVGNATSLKLLNIEYAPDILSPVTDQDRRIVANKSDSVTLKCLFEGNPIPEVTWYQGTNQEAAVSTGSTLKLDRVRQSDGGEYKCKAESLLGIAENSITLVVRGAPIITSDSEQYGSAFECGYISEPPAQEVSIVDMDTESIIHHEGTSNTEQLVTLATGTGRFECRVRNALGTTTKFIVLHPSGVSAESRLAIILAVLILLIIFAVLIVLRIKLYPRERRFKVSKPEDHHDRNMAEQASADLIQHTSRKDSLLLGYEERAAAALAGVARAAPDDSNEPAIKPRLAPDSFKIAPVIIESSSSERSQSGNDDGYGTESGSAHKDHSSHSESNSDFEINVPTVGDADYSKIRVKLGTSPKRTKQHSTSDESSSYQPQNIRNQTEKIQYQNYIISAKMNRVRSVSHV